MILPFDAVTAPLNLLLWLIVADMSMQAKEFVATLNVPTQSACLGANTMSFDEAAAPLNF